MSTFIRQEKIDRPGVLYRVGSPKGEGLWYDRQGRETRIIDTVEGAAAAALPMGPHPIFRDSGRCWISTTDSLVGLGHWFSEADLRVLIPRGYRVLRLTVNRYRRFHFVGYSHEVYCEEALLDTAIIPASSIPRNRLDATACVV